MNGTCKVKSINYRPKARKTASKPCFISQNRLIPVRHASVLHQYKRGVILLRAKHATYDKIVAMLEKVGVKTSIFSVSRFCRQHRAEIKKLRVQLESHKPPAEASEPLLRTGDVPASSPGASFAP